MARLWKEQKIKILMSNFQNFISLDCDRTVFITDYLEKKGVKTAVMNIEGKKHILVIFQKQFYDSRKKIKTVLAHYDRVENTQGANDNSFAVFILMQWAIKLNSVTYQHNIRLIFTDGEEISQMNEKKIAQGSYNLALLFKKLKINDEVFVFDCMGRGTIPVLAKTVFSEAVNMNFQKQFFSLFESAKNILKNACGNNFSILPVSYSDNAGFLANAIPAVCISMLPFDEYKNFVQNLKDFPFLEQYIFNRKIPNGWTSDKIQKMLPKTWNLIHTSDDNFLSLTENSEKVFNRILEELEK